MVNEREGCLFYKIAQYRANICCNLLPNGNEFHGRQAGCQTWIGCIWSQCVFSCDFLSPSLWLRLFGKTAQFRYFLPSLLILLAINKCDLRCKKINVSEGISNDREQARDLTVVSRIALRETATAKLLVISEMCSSLFWIIPPKFAASIELVRKRQELTSSFVKRASIQRDTGRLQSSISLLHNCTHYLSVEKSTSPPQLAHRHWRG